MRVRAVEVTDQRCRGDGVEVQFLDEPELLRVQLGKEVAVDFIKAAAGVRESGEGGVGEVGIEVDVEEG